MNLETFLIVVVSAPVALLLFGLPVLGIIWVFGFLFGLPMRRRERARIVLDLIDDGRRLGLSPEQALVGASSSRDRSLPVRLHWLAARMEMGERLGDALRHVPHLLPRRLQAMLQTGETVGGVERVLPACRWMLGDGRVQTESARHYFSLFFFAAAPIAPVMATLLATFVFPKLFLMLHDFEVVPSYWVSFIIRNVGWLAWTMLLGSAMFWFVFAIYLGGQRLWSWLPGPLRRGVDALGRCLPWRALRLQRDFAAMLAAMLDAGVPEAEALRLAGESTSDEGWRRRTRQAVEALRAGTALTTALGAMDRTGELRWRLDNASRSGTPFLEALQGWLESLDVRASQREQGFAQFAATAATLINGAIVSVLLLGVCGLIWTMLEVAVLW